MSRRAPPDPRDFVDRRAVPPRWKTPPGVIVRRLAEGEINPTPVLVCGPCSGPQLHDSRPEGPAACRRCGTERKW